MSRGVALVTGASGALGAAISTVLDDMGFSLALHYAGNESAAKELGERLTNPAMTVQADVGDWLAVTAMAAAVADELGPVGVVVNSGGVRKDGLMATQSVQEWANTIQVNLLGTFHVTRAVLPGMLRSRWGRVINVVSPAGLIGSRGQTAYSASKAGVVGMTRSLALECGRRNVTVNALSPGFIETELTREVPEEVRQDFLRRTAVRRFATADEVAAATRLLVESDYMTGQVLSIDGGLAIS